MLSIDTDRKVNEIEVTSTHDHNFCQQGYLFIFRVICAIYYTVEFIQFFTWREFSKKPIRILYLTTWGVFTTYIYFLLVTFDYIFRWRLEKTCRLFNFTIMVVEIFIFILSWTIIVPGFIHKWDTLDEANKYSVIVWHTTPIINQAIDTVWNRHLYIIKDSWVPIVYCIIYAIANATYSQLKEPIYSEITWRDWQTYACGFAETIIVIGSCFGVYYGKIALHKKLATTSNSEIINVQIDETTTPNSKIDESK